MPFSPGAGHPPGHAKAASCPFTAACKRSESPRPGSGAGRWPAARPSCPGRLAGVELLRKLSPRKGWLPCSRLNSRGMTQASPPGQAEGRGRVSLLLPGLGNYSRAPVGARASDPGWGRCPILRAGDQEDAGTQRETPTAGQAERRRENIKAEAQTQGNGKQAETEKQKERDRTKEREERK